MSFQPLLYTHREAAKLLSVSERTLYSMRVAGKIAAVRIGNTGWRYSVEALQRFIRESEEEETWLQSPTMATDGDGFSSLTGTGSEGQSGSGR